MTINMSDPRLILSAVQRIEDVLPDLVGENWANIQPQVNEYITTLQNQPNDYLASTKLFGLLSHYELARQRLSQELIIQKVIADNIQPSLINMQYESDQYMIATIMTGLSWAVDPDSIPAPENSQETRQITLKKGGTDGGKSVKFKNLDIDLNKMMTVGGGFLLSAQEMLDKPSPFIVSAGVLVMIGTLLNEITVKIEQQEATVFWGFITATHNTPQNRQATLETIITATNTERAQRGLSELTDDQIKYSIHQLETLGSINRIDENTYKIIEKFKVKA